MAAGVSAREPAQAQRAPAPAAAPLGGLMVAPTRLVFEGRRRSGELTLLNNGSTPATYRIGFVQLRLTETGSMEEVPADEGATTAAKLVRYSPRQVTLEPRTPQVVRLQLRKPAELPAGEYRSHLVFRAVPDGTPSGAASSDLSVRLVALYGVAVPVIVRQGETAAAAALQDLVVSESPQGSVLQFTISRTGNRSVFGDLAATFTPAKGRAKVVGLMNGVAVYTPNALRRVQLRLQPPPGVSLRAGRLRLTYTGAEDPEGSRPVLASAELPLP